MFLGYNKDIDNIKRFMEETLNFECVFFFDPTKEELMNILRDTAKTLNSDSRKYFCFTAFIMGHGSDVGIA